MIALIMAVSITPFVAAVAWGMLDELLMPSIELVDDEGIVQ